MEFRPPRAVGTIVGTVLAVWCLAVTLALVLRALTQDVSLGVISLYVVASLFFFMAMLFTS